MTLEVVQPQADVREIGRNVWGMLLAVPMLVAIKAVCDHVEDLKPIRETLEE